MTIETIDTRNGVATARDPFATTAVAAVRSGQISGTDQFERMGRWLELFMATAEVAKVLARTNFVPDAFRGQPEDIAAAMMRSLELGIDPLDGLSNFHAIKGRVGMSAEFMRRRVLEAGHEIVFDEQTEERCKVRGRRKGSQEWTTVVFTKAQAAQAGTQNMSKFPTDMLVARASSRLCKRVFPDVLAGMQIIEDVLDAEVMDEAAAPGATAASRPLQRKRATATRKAEPAPPRSVAPTESVANDLDEFPGMQSLGQGGGNDASQGVEPPSGPAPETDSRDQGPDSGEPGITRPQLQKLSILRQKEGYADNEDGRTDWFRWVESNIARPIATNKDLTKAEASVLIDVLETAQAADQ